MLTQWWERLVGVAPPPPQPPETAVVPLQDELKRVARRNDTLAAVGGLQHRIDEWLQHEGARDRRLASVQTAIEEVAWNSVACHVREQLDLLDTLRQLEASTVASQPLPPRTWRERLAQRLSPRTDGTQKWLEEIRLLRRRTERLLWERGVREISAAGENFDADLHVVLDVVSDLPPGRVCRVMRIGYTFMGRVVRPAEVAVGARHGPQTFTAPVQPPIATPETQTVAT